MKKGRPPLPDHLRRTQWTRRFKNEVIAMIAKTAKKQDKSDTAYVEDLIYKDNGVDDE